MIRIISWNVNGLRANVKKGAFKWFLKESPDIFCLQETKAHPDQLDEATRSPEGYVSFFDHSKVKKGYSGVAIYVKKKIKVEKVEYGLGVPKLDQEGRFLAVFFDDFVLITTYFPNGGGGPVRLKYKLDFYDAFLKYINRLQHEGKKVIFCGDVNTAHTEIDLARPKENEENTGFLPVERKWIDRVLRSGYVDIFRYFHPNDVGKYTYWDMKTFARDRNVGWRIDYFFCSKDILPLVHKAEILDSVMGSDHCPIDIILK
jgi:exodeoxyribonuclease-3